MHVPLVQLTISLVVLLGLATSSGCGCSCSSALKRKAVFGKISSAREVRAVTFQPQEGLKAPAVTCEVRDGAYQFNKDDGPIAGEYLARFQFADVDVTFNQTGKKNPKEISAAPPVEIDPRTRRPVEPPPPPPDPVVPVTVPVKGSLEIDITVP